MCFTSAGEGWGPRWRYAVTLFLAAAVGPRAEVSSSGSATRPASPPGPLWFPLLPPGERHVCPTALGGGNCKQAPTKHGLSTYCVLGQHGLDLVETSQSKTSSEGRGACPQPPRGRQVEADRTWSTLPWGCPDFLESHPCRTPLGQPATEAADSPNWARSPPFGLSLSEQELQTGCPRNLISPRGGGHRVCIFTATIPCTEGHRDEGRVTQQVKGSRELNAC